MKMHVEPTVIMTLAESSEKRCSNAKYAIIAISAILIVTTVLAALLVGVYLFGNAQKEIIKLAYSRGGSWKEEVVSDGNTNIVQYHITDDSHESWIFNDFNRDIQVMKIHSTVGTNCYVTPLNRTIAPEPSDIVANCIQNSTKPDAQHYVSYRAGQNPISDVSFLSTSARDACNGISTYWLFPSCGDRKSNGLNATKIEFKQRKIRQTNNFGLFIFNINSNNNNNNNNNNNKNNKTH